MRSIRNMAGLVTVATLLGCPTVTQATWSIVLIDTATREIAIGSATCLTGFDLRAGLPVVLVDIGAAAAQSAIDAGGANRMRIRAELLAGQPPATILQLLDDQDTQHQQRQYGIADTLGRTITFTGSGAGAFADGTTGQLGSMVYAIQGNVLTGAAVIDQARSAVLGTDGDLPDRLLAGMQAAYAMGGDGRCSCAIGNPTGCGAPPPSFVKSAHIGFMIVARGGDIDGACTGTDGCAAGDYFMNFNVANQTASDPDPVLQLADLFMMWRAAHVGRPDAVHSTWTLDPPAVVADGTGSATLTVTLRDWQDAPVDLPAGALSVQHADDSAETSVVGVPIALGAGQYVIAVEGSTLQGVDRFDIVADDGTRPVTLLPRPQWVSAAPEDTDRDGDVDGLDFALVVSCLTGPAGEPTADCATADVTLTASIDLGDVARLQQAFTAAPCVVLHLVAGPVAQNLQCGDAVTLTADLLADPEPTWQWWLNGTPIAGATTASYHVPAVDNTDHGDYHVTAASSCGTVSSDDVLIRVFPTPCP